MPELKVCNSCGTLHQGTGPRCVECHVPKRATAKQKAALAYHVYRSSAWKRARTQALERDGYLCRRCKRADDLIVHHIVEVSPGMDPYEVENLEVLCRGCHAREHNSRRAHARSLS